MPGFSSIGEIPAADDAGRTWVTQFRKLVASAATATSGFVDYLYFAGSPAANFYASAPLVSAEVESERGIYSPDVAPYKKFLKNLTTMSAASSATATTNQRQRLIVADYLLYYPFIDTDAVGEEQAMENSVSLPRYTAGQVVAVAQSAASTVGTFTFTYTNQDGTSGRVSQAAYTLAVAGGGQVVATAASDNGYHPYLALQTGDTGVRSIESCTFSAAGGGLMALVIVKPLITSVVSQECRRTTSGNLESYGSADSFDTVIHQAGMPEIKDGAVVGLLGQGYAGTLASSTLVGTLETIWN
jgi:hypothetical protein